MKRSGQLLQVTAGAVFVGMLFGWLCLAMEKVTGYKVYTLLMNVDYFPVLKNYALPTWLEFSLHLIVCIILTLLIYYMAQKNFWSSKKIIFNTLSINSLIAIMIYPTTVFSQRTPELTSVPSILLWILAHLIYGALLGIFLNFNLKRHAKQ